MTGDRLRVALQAVSGLLIADASLGQTLERIATVARDSVGAVKAAGLTLLDHRERPTTAVYTDDLVEEVDRVQYERGSGPCLDAYRLFQVVRVDDTAAAVDRYPDFSAEALRHGVLSALSLPLGAAGQRFGALNLYATETDGLSEANEADLLDFATQASVVVANARAYWDASDLVEGLRQAMEFRAVIEQAKGKLMATSRCTSDEAFALLVQASQRENRKLRDIARCIVEGARPDGVDSPA